MQTGWSSFVFSYSILHIFNKFKEDLKNKPVNNKNILSQEIEKEDYKLINRGAVCPGLVHLGRLQSIRKKQKVPIQIDTCTQLVAGSTEILDSLERRHSQVQI